jgi:Tol biopolymer transport system component
MTTSPTRRILSFDATVLVVVTALVALITAVILAGDQVGLRVVSVAPTPEAASVSVSAPLAVRFDDRLVVSPDDVQISVNPPVSGSLDVQGEMLRFAPATALTPNTTYTVTLAAGLQGERGRKLLQPLVWTFRTGQVRLIYIALDDAARDQLYALPVTPQAQGNADAPQPLTTSVGGVWDFAVSPDGNRIVFSALNEGGTSDLWLLSSGDPTATKLVECLSAACSGAAWSPDGRTIAYSKRNATELAPALVSPPRLWLLDTETGENAQVFADNQKLGYDPAWSADGDWLSFLSPDPIGVGVINLTSGDSQVFATSSGEAGVWHPQRLEMLMTVMTETQQSGAPVLVTHIVGVDPLSGQQRNLSGADELVEDNTPAFSPDGEWIAFRRKEFEGERASPGKQLWLMRSDGSEARPLTQAPEYDHGNPLWSPDGRYLTFQKFPLKGPEIVVSVWMMDPTTGEQWQVVSPGQRPQWGS